MQLNSTIINSFSLSIHHCYSHSLPFSSPLTVLQSAMVHSEDPEIQRKIAKLQRKMGGAGADMTSSHKQRRSIEHADTPQRTPRSAEKVKGSGGRGKYAKMSARLNEGLVMQTGGAL